jgi:hypothetical protein
LKRISLLVLVSALAALTMSSFDNSELGTKASSEKAFPRGPLPGSNVESGSQDDSIGLRTTAEQIITSLSNQKKKKAYFKWSTKGWKHRAHRSSRDSGVGSSSAFDRASLGTINESPVTYEQFEDQRHTLSSVRDALDAANEKIRALEASYFKLNTALTESNKENRLLEREKEDLFNKIKDLLSALSDEKEINKRLGGDTSPRTGSEVRGDQYGQPVQWRQIQY